MNRPEVYPYPFPAISVRINRSPGILLLKGEFCSVPNALRSIAPGRVTRQRMSRQKTAMIVSVNSKALFCFSDAKWVNDVSIPDSAMTLTPVISRITSARGADVKLVTIFDAAQRIPSAQRIFSMPRLYTLPTHDRNASIRTRHAGIKGNLLSSVCMYALFVISFKSVNVNNT